MRWIAFPIALLAGLSLAFVVAASAQSICPSGYHPIRHHHVTLCLRTVTRTTTVRLAALPPQTVTATTPGSTTTVLQPAATVTGPTTTETATDTQTVTDTTVSTQTETTTVQAPPVTTTVTVTTAAPSTVSLTWCGGYGGNWSDGNCDAPPNPLSVPSGSRVELAALAQGSAADPALGCLDFTVPQHPVGAVWSEYDQEYGLNPAASQDCSCVENFSGQASGACLYTFGTGGVYEVSVAAGTAARIATDVQVG